MPISAVWKTLAMSVALGGVVSAFETPEHATRVAEVSHLGEAIAWSQEKGVYAPRELFETFGLERFPAGVERALRFATREENGPQQALVLWGAEEPPPAQKRPGRHRAEGNGFWVVATDQELAKQLVESAASEANQKAWPYDRIAALRRRSETWPEGESPRVWLSHRWPEHQNEPAAKRHGFDRLGPWTLLLGADARGGYHGVGALTAVGPLQSTAGMFRLRAVDEVSCPGWIAAVAPRLTVLRVDLPRALRDFGPAFDDLYAQGLQGTYDEVLVETRDPAGMGLDLETDLYDLLGDSVIFGEVTGKDDGDRSFVALRCKPGESARVADAVRRLMVDDPEAELFQAAPGRPAYWRYQEGSGMTAGVGVVGEWLCFANQSGVLAELGRARLDHAGLPSFTQQPPERAFADRRHGALFVDRLPEESPAGPFRLFWDWSDLQTPLIAKGRLRTDPIRRMLAPFAAGSTGWAASGPEGWLFESQTTTPSRQADESE